MMSKSLTELKKERTVLESELFERELDLGNFLFDEFPSLSLENDEIPSLYENIQKNIESLEVNKKEQGDVRELRLHKDEVKDEIDLVQKEIADLVAQITPLREEWGEEIYYSHQELPFLDKEIINYTKKIQRLDEKRQKPKKEWMKPFKDVEEQKRVLYEKLASFVWTSIQEKGVGFKRVNESEFFKRIQEVENQLIDVRQNLERKRELIQTLRVEVRKNPLKRLVASQDVLINEKRQYFIELGRIVYELREDPFFLGDEKNSLFPPLIEAIESQYRKYRACSVELEKRQLNQEIESLEKECEREEKQIDSLKESLSKRQSELDEIKEKIKRKESELASKEDLTGEDREESPNDDERGE